MYTHHALYTFTHVHVHVHVWRGEKAGGLLKARLHANTHTGVNGNNGKVGPAGTTGETGTSAWIDDATAAPLFGPFCLA